MTKAFISLLFILTLTSCSAHIATVTMSAPFTTFFCSKSVDDTNLIIQNDINDYTIDFTFLEIEVGLTDPADLFTITFRDRGFNISNTPIGLEAGIFRTPDNQDIDVDVSALLQMGVVCASPDATTIESELEYTPGTTNTIKWLDMWFTGAIQYTAIDGDDLYEFLLLEPIWRGMWKVFQLIPTLPPPSGSASRTSNRSGLRSMEWMASA